MQAEAGETVRIARVCSGENWNTSFPRRADYFELLLKDFLSVGESALVFVHDINRLRLTSKESEVVLGYNFDDRPNFRRKDLNPSFLVRAELVVHSNMTVCSIENLLVLVEFAFGKRLVRRHLYLSFAKRTEG
jgi:hypothetical protein